MTAADDVCPLLIGLVDAIADCARLDADSMPARMQGELARLLFESWEGGRLGGDGAGVTGPLLRIARGVLVVGLSRGPTTNDMMVEAVARSLSEAWRLGAIDPHDRPTREVDPSPRAR